jgi:hypothetical protein
MLNVLNQFKRMINDDGRDDKSFIIDEARLKLALYNLNEATNKLIRASQTLHDLLVEKEPPGALH